MQTITMEDVKGVKGKGFLHNKGTDDFTARVVTAGGRMTAGQARLLADLADRFGSGLITFTTRQSVEVPGIPFSKLADFEAAVGQIGLSVGGTGPKVRPVVACKGTTCPCGLIDTAALAEAIHRRFYEGWHTTALPGKFKIAVGGCPNNCVKPDLNDLGIVGKVLPGGKRGYRVMLGGHWGRTGGVGVEAAVFETQEEVLDFIEKILNFYRENGKPGERFFKVWQWKRAADVLNQGGVIVLPTDTVYGLGARPDHADAVERLYTIKGREAKKPIALLASDIAAIERFGCPLTGKARELAERHWPGALTLVIGKEGFRIPDHERTRKLIAACGGVLRVTSANLSGKHPATDAPQALRAVGLSADFIVDDGVSPGGVPSTVVRVNEDGSVEVLREGGVKI